MSSHKKFNRIIICNFKINKNSVYAHNVKYIQVKCKFYTRWEIKSISLYSRNVGVNNDWH